MSYGERHVDDPVSQRATAEVTQPHARERLIVRLDAVHHLVTGSPQLVRSTGSGTRFVLGQ